jgi:hypothetical protein
LNNYLNFCIDESTGQSTTTVEVDPILLPKPQPLSISKNRRSSEVEQILDTSDVDDDQNLQGMFYSSSFVSIRWANDDAGEDTEAKDVSSKGHHPVRAELLRTSIAYSKPQVINRAMVEISLNVDLNLEGAFYPGLDPTANLK